MGLPSTNEKGYHDGSAINYTQGLTGNLLIIHGSGDDNDHFAATEDLVNRLSLRGRRSTLWTTLVAATPLMRMRARSRMSCCLPPATSRTTYLPGLVDPSFLVVTP